MFNLYPKAYWKDIPHQFLQVHGRGLWAVNVDPAPEDHPATPDEVLLYFDSGPHLPVEKRMFDFRFEFVEMPESINGSDPFWVMECQCAYDIYNSFMPCGDHVQFAYQEDKKWEL